VLVVFDLAASELAETDPVGLGVVLELWFFEQPDMMRAIKGIRKRI
jgi:hypothetical protein